MQSASLLKIREGATETIKVVIREPFVMTPSEWKHNLNESVKNWKLT